VRGYFDGCFDIMHSGHYNALRQAKSICDVLVVGVHSDLEIERNKGLPVMREEERYALLAHIKWIDEILYDVPYSPQLATLEMAKAHFCIHGDDVPVNSQGVSAYDEMTRAGRLRIVHRTEGVSTTDLIGKLLLLSRRHHTLETTGCAAGLAGRPLSVARVLEHRDMLSPALARGGDLYATVATLELVAELARKYRMDPEDVERLHSSIASGCSTRATGSSAVADELGEEPEVRARSQVQMLTSTRRISEFASSRLPTPEDRLVYVSGSFDMFHVGHAQFMKDARALGTFLLVGIHDDATVSQAKGPNLPVMTLYERLLNVCACRWADEVIIGAPRSVTADLLSTWGIHIVARGSGHARNGDPGPAFEDSYAVPKAQRIYVEVPSKWPDLCHETIVSRLVVNRELYLRQQRGRTKKEEEYYEAKVASAPSPECAVIP